MLCISPAQCGIRFMVEEECPSGCPGVRLPPYIASVANDYIGIGFGGRYGEGLCGTGGIDRQIAICEDISL